MKADTAQLRMEMQHHDLTCMFFFVEDCPVSMRDFAVVSGLRKAYPEDRLGVVAVYLGSKSDRLKIIADSIGIDILYLADHNHHLVAMMEAVVTPEYFLFAPSGKIHYRGSIDNYVYGYGKHRNRVSQQYLRNAIEQALNGKAVTKAVTRPYGCAIEKVSN